MGIGMIASSWRFWRGFSFSFQDCHEISCGIATVEMATQLAGSAPPLYQTKSGIPTATTQNYPRWTTQRLRQNYAMQNLSRRSWTVLSRANCVLTSGHVTWILGYKSPPTDSTLIRLSFTSPLSEVRSGCQQAYYPQQTWICCFWGVHAVFPISTKWSL